ncbi:uncharacterized protein si:ch211-218c6.8 [Engraulis encrasicolus]|uniref:uncharacterized protein si:ch211-218c6.8 n=1 Tax=Engraulis encrasicolus TaxID=184585 RepID=UPI002FD4366D
MEPGESIAASSEFKLLQAYCERRTKKKTKSKKRISAFNDSPVTDMSVPNTRLFLFSAAPQHQSGPPLLRGPVRQSDGDELGNVADKLTQIADNVDVECGRLECDFGEEDVIQKLVALLRSTGDELDAELKKNPALLKQLQDSFSYSLFERVTQTFLSYVLPSPSSPSAASASAASSSASSSSSASASASSSASGSATPSSQQAQQIAMTFEVTSRLSVLDGQPMNRVLGFGAQYLQQNYSGWVQQHGGWDKAFDAQDDDDDDDEVQ